MWLFCRAQRQHAGEPAAAIRIDAWPNPGKLDLAFPAGKLIRARLAAIAEVK
jgi:hypothetical protein